jgi:alpha-L-fucosidase 2
MLVLVLAASAMSAACEGQTAARSHSVARQNVSWDSLGRDERDSMPLGNGDLAANVWTEQNGDLVLLVAKSDAYTEMGKLVKLGRVRLHFAPQLFSANQTFSQTLRLDRGDFEIASGLNTIRIWIDAGHPALHVEVQAAMPAKLTASLETWRTTHPLRGTSADKAGMFELGGDDFPVDFQADTIVPAGKSSVEWYHFNEKSIYPTVLEQEHLGNLLGKYTDPLLHRCFGARLSGPGLIAENDKTLASSIARKDLRLDLTALTEVPATSPAAWKEQLDAVARQANPVELAVFWAAHLEWWNSFWNRSWIDVSGDNNAESVTQGYVIQRYMMAASSRGELPVKFNGGLFTVGHDMAEDAPSTAADHDPDYRAWGNSFWNQNIRLLYWPLVTTGDFDLLKPWFNLYVRALPLARDRTRSYYHHDGASFPETMYFWGVSNLNDFGWNNPTNEIKSAWQRYHIQGSLEVVAEMLDYYDATWDNAFARSSLVPFADAVATFYDHHYPRGSDGKIRMTPTQSLETYQVDAVNPTPDIAGLRSVLPRMIALPAALAGAKRVAMWQKMLNDLPPIPMGKSAANGKTPPMGVGDPQGVPVILPAEQYGKTSNSENPELYVSFPYHLYGVDKPDLSLAQATFAARRFPQNTCWGQDGTEAAALGLTEVAQKGVIAEFTDYGDQRFRWFWKAGHDWIPDLDNGGSGMITLQEMLMQTNGRKILLLPAWPEDWTADFKLHAAFNTTVEGHVEHGRVTQLTVVPKERKNDVVVEQTSGVAVPSGKSLGLSEHGGNDR